MVVQPGARLVAAVLMIALQSCAAGTSSASPQPPSATQGSAMNDAAAKVDQLGRERFADRYAGLEIGAERLVVFRKPSTAFDDAVRGQNLEVPVDLRDAPYSGAELQALADRVAADIDHWKDRGIEISSIGPRQDGTAVEVGTPQPAKLAPLLAERYGTTPPAVAVSIGPIAPAN